MDNWTQGVGFSFGVLVLVAVVSPRAIQRTRRSDGKINGSFLFRGRWLETREALSSGRRTDRVEEALPRARARRAKDRGRPGRAGRWIAGHVTEAKGEV